MRRLTTLFMISICLMFLCQSCKPGDLEKWGYPSVTLVSVSSVTQTSAICVSNVTSDGNSSVNKKGVCWSTSKEPTIEDDLTNDGYWSGTYTSIMTDLDPNTTYYVRAYATNGVGTNYSETMSFTTKLESDIGEINGYEYVDLGLPSGLKWATCNVGASSPEMPGGYYAWGELETKDYYGSDNSTTYEIELEDISGDPYYDVARAKWGSTWRMPKVGEINELKANCSYPEEIEINGRKAYKYTSNINGCSIILPHTGYKSYYNHYSYNAYGCYWSSTPYSSSLNNRAYAKEGYGNSVSTPERYYGFTIRPVSD